MTMRDGRPCCELYAEQLMYNHCCDSMTECTHHPNIPLNYQPIFRRYVIPLGGSKTEFQQIFFCPWCRTKLPESLEEKYYEILEKEYGITQELATKHKRRIPREFKSNEWWKKRGL